MLRKLSPPKEPIRNPCIEIDINPREEGHRPSKVEKLIEVEIDGPSMSY